MGKSSPVGAVFAVSLMLLGAGCGESSGMPDGGSPLVDAGLMDAGTAPDPDGGLVDAGSEVDGGTTPTRPLSPGFSLTSGGVESAGSASYRLRVATGAPNPMGVATSANYRVVIGPNAVGQ